MISEDNTLTVMDANELKLILEAQILELISEFENKTELTIERVFVSHTDRNEPVVVVRAVL